MRKFILFIVITFCIIQAVQAQSWQEVTSNSQVKRYIDPQRVKVKTSFGLKSVRYCEKVVLSSYERPETAPKPQKRKSGITSESASAFITGAAGGGASSTPSAGGRRMLKFKKPYIAYIEVRTLGCKSNQETKQLRKNYDARGNAVESFTEYDLQTHYEKTYPGEKDVKKLIYDTYCKSNE